MIIITRVKDKFYYGGKIVCPITEEEYNLFNEIRTESTPIQGRGFITFGSDFVFDADANREENEPTPMTDLVKGFEDRCKSIKKEMQAVKAQKIKIK